MMKITFSPMRKDEALKLEKSGESLVVNGVVFDFSTLEEGAEINPEGDEPIWFAGPVRRISGEIVCALILPHGPDAPQATLFPKPLEAVPDGPVDVPLHSEPDFISEPSGSL